MSEEEKKIDEKFLKEYQKLVEKYKRTLSFSPSWRHSQDGNDFRLVINTTLQRLE